MSRSCPNNSTTRNLAIWKPEPTERGSFRILSTCTITLALCVWTAVHLKVPHRRDYRMAQFVRKTRWVLIRLLAPEIVALTALQQLATAKFISAAVGEAFPIVTGGARREGNRKWEAAADGRVPVSAVIRKWYAQVQGDIVGTLYADGILALVLLAAVDLSHREQFGQDARG